MSLFCGFLFLFCGFLKSTICVWVLMKTRGAWSKNQYVTEINFRGENNNDLGDVASVQRLATFAENSYNKQSVHTIENGRTESIETGPNWSSNNYTLRTAVLPKILWAAQPCSAGAASGVFIIFFFLSLSLSFSHVNPIEKLPYTIGLNIIIKRKQGRWS